MAYSDSNRVYHYANPVVLDLYRGEERVLDVGCGSGTLAQQLRDNGKNPYIIPGGGSNEIGSLGYVNAALELTTQANDRSLHIDHLVHATGSAGTQAGLLVGMEGINSGIPVYGVNMSRPRQEQEEMVFDLAQRTSLYLGLNSDVVKREKVIANGDYFGDGYGRPTPAMVEAVKMAAQYEGILLDPVYSGKGFSGLIDLIRKGHFKKGENVVFLQTGGSVSLFAYPDIFDLPGYI